MEAVIKHLSEKGFSDILYFSPGSIQIAANRQKYNVAVWFYSKHSLASLEVYEGQWNLPNRPLEVFDIWDYLDSNDFYKLEEEVKDDMGGLLNPIEVIEIFDRLWNTYLNEVEQ